jgi:hypothetical protein
VEPAIRAANEYEGSIVIDFQVEREINVFPMVPQGNSIGEMLTEQPEAVIEQIQAASEQIQAAEEKQAAQAEQEEPTTA